MTIKQIYELAIKMGVEADLRGKKRIQNILKKNKENFDSLKKEEKEEFDKETLTNPYADSRLFTDQPDKRVKRILTGIDIETEEILLANELSKKKPIDLVLAHHPTGKALAGLHEVMDMQAEILAQYGVPINVAQNLLHVRISEVTRKLNPVNHNEAVDAAKLLDFSLMCIHTPIDNLVTQFIKKLLEKNENKIETVADILKILKSIPEYQLAAREKAGPSLFAGKSDNFTGKIAMTEMTGGTEGSKEIYEKLSQAGIGTVIGMHMSEEHKVEAEKHHVNAIMAGHISSDSIGMNLFLDELEKRGIEVIPCSGLIRVKRFRRRK